MLFLTNGKARRNDLSLSDKKMPLQRVNSFLCCALEFPDMTAYLLFFTKKEVKTEFKVYKVQTRKTNPAC